MALHLPETHTRLSLFLYSIFLRLYKTGIWLISPWNPKARLWIHGRRLTMNKLLHARIPPNRKLVWMHCASLGEFEQGRPVIEKLRTYYPDCYIALSFFSPSGYEIRKDYSGADLVFYLPSDSRKHARQLLALLNPALVLWVKYDYWFFYLQELKNKAIPVLLISAIFRPDQVFFRWYGSLHRRMLGCISHFFVQNEPSVALLKQIGFDQSVSLSGDTRFDRVIEIMGQFEPVPGIDAFCADSPVIVAGSTWEEDEEQLDHYANVHPEIKFVIAPHEIGEAQIRDIEKIFQSSIRYSEWIKRKDDLPNAGQANKYNTLIIDNIGMLARLYKYATICYVGGGFGDDGVHNVLEAAVYGRPVLYGPVIEKYVEAMELADSGGAIVVDSALEVEVCCSRLLANEDELRQRSTAAQEYVYSRQGATECIVSFIQENRLLTS